MTDERESESYQAFILAEAKRIQLKQQQQGQSQSESSDTDAVDVLVETYLANVESRGPEAAWSLADFKRRRQESKHLE